MTPRFEQQLERRRDLQADEVLFGLDAAERAELEALGFGADFRKSSSADGHVDLEGAAATLAAALTMRDDLVAGPGVESSAAVDALPPDLAARLRADADAHFAAAAPVGVAGGGARATGFVFPRRRMVSFAAAAMLFLTCGLIGLQVMQSTWFTQKMLMAERNALLANYGQAVEYRTLHTTADQAPRGDVVWCDEAQRGYVTIGGLPVSQAGVDRYRIWIYLADAAGREHAVDAGAFAFDDRDCELVIEVEPVEMVVDIDRVVITSEPVDGAVDPAVCETVATTRLEA